MQEIFSDSTSGKYQKLYTVLKLEEIEELGCFYTSKTLSQIYCENTRLPKEFPSLAGKKASARGAILMFQIAVSQIPYLRVRMCIGLSGVITQLRLTVKVQIVVSCHYLICVIT